MKTKAIIALSLLAIFFAMKVSASKEKIGLQTDPASVEAGPPLPQLK